jgi:ATP/maltotriose-dependent transcriptional regulator MalT/DNA-binding SARP family transcriptional activator
MDGIAGAGRGADRSIAAARAGRRSLQAIPPVLPGWLVTRPRLDRLLDDSVQRRLTTVVADAGFGKSTVLAAWAASRRCAWYTAGPQDRRLSSVAAGLLDAIRLIVPDMPAEVDPSADGRGPDAAIEELRRADALGAALALALHERLRRELVLIVDDLHELPAGEPGARLVEALVRGGPPLLRLVLASRSELPFAIERLRAQGHVASIGGADLAFTIEETADALDAAIGERDDELARDLHGRTQGWPAAVRLAVDALGPVEAADRRAVLRRVLHSSGPVYDYLAEEVLGREPAVVLELLRTVAPLDRVDPGLCEALGFADAGRVLASLERNGLFVQAVGEGDSFVLHPLVRDFVRTRHGLPAEAIARVHTVAAEWAAARGDLHEALSQLMLAGDPVRLHEFLVERGPGLISSGDVDTVHDAIAALPDDRRDDAIHALEGEARQTRGDWEGALAAYGRVAGANGPIPARIAWRMGLIHHFRGDLDAAFAVYRRGDARPDDPRNAALLRAWWAAACWLRGELEPCRELAAAALQDATVAGDDQALAAVHTVLAMLAAMDSDRRANDAHYLRALHHAMRAGDVLQQIRIRTNRGSRLTEEGNYEDALGELDVAIGLADVAGFAAFRALALSNRGEALTQLGRLDEAVADLEAARVLYTRLESSMVGYPLWHLGDVYRIRGDHTLARASYEEAILVAEAGQDLQGLVPALSGLALVLADEDPDRARELAQRAAGYPPVLAYTRAVLARGWVELARGDRPAATASALQAVDVARSRRDRAGLAEALELRVAASDQPGAEVARLEEALAIWRDVRQPIAAARVELAIARLGDPSGATHRIEGALRTFRELGARRLAAEAAALLSEPSPDRVRLTIRTLGGFEAIREIGPIDAVAWQSRKARALLKILVARRGHTVPREALIEILWPDDDPAVASRRLSVALSTVRTVLDPERRLDADTFVGSDRRSIWVDAEHVALDYEAFLEIAERGLGGRTTGEHAVHRLDADALRQAEAAYRGDFLEEDLYEDWSVPLREELREVYLQVVRALAGLAARDGDQDLAVSYSLRVLERDAYDELAHLGLVTAFANAGRHGEARRAYGVYAVRMSELGVEAAPFPA